MHMGGPTNPHNDPEYARATQQLRTERAKRLARMAPWERGIVLVGGPLVLVVAVIVLRWLAG